jgi:predicted ATPase/class 3 adenylate cyclase
MSVTSRGAEVLVLRRNLPSGSVTFLFTDIEGSTRLARMLGAGYRVMLTEHRRILLRAFQDCGGVALFTEGDSIFAAFDRASDAISACVEGQRALAAYGWETEEARPHVRMGLHTGHAVPADGEYATPEVHRASRVASAAHGGQVLCSEATMRAAGELAGGAWMLDLGLHRLRGFDERDRLFQLVAPGLGRQFPRLRTIATGPHNLPAPATSFVGRVAERASLSTLLAANRLVSVVGPGGAGKTRLAVEVASNHIADHPDGVWFVDLAAVTDPGLVAVSVAAALGLRPEPGRAVLDTLHEFTASRTCLFVLDTCDAQPSATAALVSKLLASGSSCRVLATSREPLNLPGEVVWRIPPLSQKTGRDGSPSDAVALLLERTAASRGDAALAGAAVGGPSADTIEITALAEIAKLAAVARKLDGLPLALELAAARLRLLSAGELLSRLDGAIDALDAGVAVGSANVADVAAERHATIQATVSWSYRTLGDEAARLLRWMSVFSSRVDLDAISWMAGGDPMNPLAVLVEKSLVAAERGPEGTVYRMLDPIRAYASRRLRDRDEEQGVHARHVEWSLHAMDEAHRGPDGKPATLSMYAIDPLAEEARAALKWSVSNGQASDGLILAGGLDQWWRERGLAREGRLWLFRLYERIAVTGETVAEPDMAAAYHMHSLHAGADGEHAEALRFSQRAEAVARRTGDKGLLARVRAGRAVPLLEMGDPAAAEKACRDVLSWVVSEDVAHEALDAVYCLAQLLWRRGALDEAAELLATARPIEASRPVERGRRTIDMILGMTALSRGDLVAAHEHLVVALRSRMSFGYHSGACELLNALAARCALGGEQAVAAQLFGAAQAAQQQLRGANALFVPFWTEQQGRIRERLGDGEFDAMYARGSALTLDEAVTIALSVDHPDMAVDSDRFANEPTVPQIDRARQRRGRVAGITSVTRSD